MTAEEKQAFMIYKDILRKNRAWYGRLLDRVVDYSPYTAEECKRDTLILCQDGAGYEVPNPTLKYISDAMLSVMKDITPKVWELVAETANRDLDLEIEQWYDDVLEEETYEDFMYYNGKYL